MAARYWRVIGLRTDGATGVAITQAALWGATGMIDAVLSASHAPASGSLAYLTDGDLADTTTWGQAQVSAPGFALVWDAGAAVDAVNVRFGSADDSAVGGWYTLQSQRPRGVEHGRHVRGPGRGFCPDAFDRRPAGRQGRRAAHVRRRDFGGHVARGRGLRPAAPRWFRRGH
ncbi:hypothetical protein GO497_00015 [Acidovorax citrulli]|nr:hypothetical protein [Paracidovorax citrulli]